MMMTMTMTTTTTMTAMMTMMMMMTMTMMPPQPYEAAYLRGNLPCFTELSVVLSNAIVPLLVCFRCRVLPWPRTCHTLTETTNATIPLARAQGSESSRSSGLRTSSSFPLSPTSLQRAIRGARSCGLIHSPRWEQHSCASAVLHSLLLWPCPVREKPVLVPAVELDGHDLTVAVHKHSRARDGATPPCAHEENL